MLKANNLKIEYSDIIFQNVNFKLGNSEKVGLVGLNGSGKSTLMRIIVGEEKPDQGSVNVLNEKIGYLPQILDLDREMLVGEYLESLVDNHLTDMWKVEKILSRLGLEITDEYFYEIGALSDGQKMKLYLAKLLLEESTVLLLDEPTNHLDIEGIIWFENFLRTYEGIVMVISHDRLFLNNLVNVIFEIDEQTLNIFHGNYDDYIEQKIQWEAKRNESFVLQEKKRKKLEERLDLVKKFSSGKKQGAAVRAIKTRIKREITDNEITKYKKTRLSGISLEGGTHSRKTMISLKNVSFAYNDEPIIKSSNLELYGKDRAWFYGSNGIGKSTLIKLIINELKPDSGQVKIGENLKWSYFSQNQSHLPKNTTVSECLRKSTGIDYSQSFGLLERFLFPKHLQNYDLSQLSPGQRARLSFAIFSMSENDLLILDEPTNHLDISTKEVIEQALADYQGTILLISHDRYFVDQIGINRQFTLESGIVVEG